MTTPSEPSSALPAWDRPASEPAETPGAGAPSTQPAGESSTPSDTGAAEPAAPAAMHPTFLPPSTLPGMATPPAGAEHASSAASSAMPPPVPSGAGMPPPSMPPGSVPPAGGIPSGAGTPQSFSAPPARTNRAGMLLLGGAGCICLLLLLCVGGLSLFGSGIVASLSGGGTPTPLFTIAPPATAIALATATTPGLPPIVLPTARSTAIGLPTAQLTAFVLPTARSTAITLPTARGSPVGPISRQTPSGLPTARGTQAANGAVLSAVKFAPGVLAADDSPVDPLDSFPAGTNVMYATFTYSNLNPGTPYRSEWLKNGVLQTDLQTSGTWKSDAAGNWWASLTNPNGITPATWQYNFYVNDKLASSGKVTIESAPSGQPNFTSIVFGSDKDANDAPVNPTDPTDPKLDAGIDSLWAFFDGVSVPKGTKFSVQWLLNGKVYADKTEYTWNLTPNESNYQSVHNSDGSPLTEGTYEIKVWIGTRLVKLAAVTLSTP